MIDCGPARVVGGSFRDPAGFVFTRDDVLYRQVNEAGADDYAMLMTSGMYAELTDAGQLVRHEEVDLALASTGTAVRVLRPQRVPFISYPYEWCFSQLKDAALLTLALQKTAMRHGMSLKDATPYNVAFDEGRPVWIDTLSFERLRADAPWAAYRQYCEMFLAPLALMSHTDVRLQHLLGADLEGIPVDLASRLLPWRTRLSFGLAVHVHLHAATGRRAARTPAPRARARVSPHALPALVDSLERATRKLQWTPAGTTWSNYYEDTNYTDAAFAHKREIVNGALDLLAPAVVWDLGANDGTFSRLAADHGARVLAFDVDPAAVEKNYRQVVERRETRMLPLLMDLTNPSSPRGWASDERQSLARRGPADLALALALIHHLAIGHNVPLERIAAFMASITRALLIEWVPKGDSQVQRMLATREDIFKDYSQSMFERAFAAHFVIDQVTSVRDSHRAMYLMRRRCD